MGECEWSGRRGWSEKRNPQISKRMEEYIYMNDTTEEMLFIKTHGTYIMHRPLSLVKVVVHPDQHLHAVCTLPMQR